MLLVVRGSNRISDPFYRSITKDKGLSKYGVVEMDGDMNVVSVETVTDGRSLDEKCKKFDTVYLDMRDDDDLVSKVNFRGGVDATDVMHTLRSKKTDDEVQKLMALANKTTAYMSEEIPSFRGTVAEEGYASFGNEMQYDGFTQKHYGMMSDGLCSNICKPFPKTEHWEKNIDAAAQCLNKVEELINVGANVPDIESSFSKYMYDANLVQNAPLLTSIGYESIEPLYGSVIHENQVLSLTASFEKMGETCVLRYPVVSKKNEVYRNSQDTLLYDYRKIATSLGVDINKISEFAKTDTESAVKRMAEILLPKK